MALAELAEAPRTRRKIDPQRVVLNNDGFAFRSLMVRLPSETIADDLKEPDLWSLVQASPKALRKFDQILIVSYDEAWLAEAYVAQADREGVYLAKPRITSLAERSVNLFSDGTYKVTWNGQGYNVVRIHDEHVMSEGLANPSLAERALASLYPRSV